jgi:hypothetical protein
MCRFLGIIFFLTGSTGMLLHRWGQQKSHTGSLLEMHQSLLRLHNAVAGRHLAIVIALRQEAEQCADWLADYYMQVCRYLERHSSRSVQTLLQEAQNDYLREHTTAEERYLWMQALGALFCVHSPGDDKGFLAYFRQFDELQKKDYMTKRERQKVTACTMGTGFVMLLLLLL